MGYPTRRAHHHPPQDFSKVYSDIPVHTNRRSNWLCRRFTAFGEETGFNVLERNEIIGLTLFFLTLGITIGYQLHKHKKTTS